MTLVEDFPKWEMLYNNIAAAATFVVAGTQSVAVAEGGFYTNTRAMKRHDIPPRQWRSMMLLIYWIVVVL